MRWLALDLGSKTIGLALCDEEETVATPWRTLRRKGGAYDLDQVSQAFRQSEAQGVVIGLPLALSGSEGIAADRVRRFGRALEAALGCRLDYWDERYTTAAAERVLLDADLSRAKRKAVIDHVASALILQAFIDSRRGTCP
jgi:putative Holliday junction resolvase